MQTQGQQTSQHTGHRARLRTRFDMNGLDGFQDYEVLELMLTYVIPRCDVKPVAKRLLQAFHTLAAVLDAPREELERIAGVGPRTSRFFQFQRALISRYYEQGLAQADVLNTPEKVVAFARAKLIGLRHEVFMIVLLNNNNEVITHIVLHQGTVNETMVYPRRILEEALKHRATGVILVHNHPSGHVAPSCADRDLTDAVVAAARTVSLQVVDHLIVGRGGYTSLRAQGMLSGRACADPERA